MPPTRRPNVICILSDEHFGGAMSHAGDRNVRTPNMDRLAREGVSFSRAYANCPICVPSRGTIFSGRHAHCGPVQHFFDAYKPLAPSLATMLREEGYRTAYFGKWHCGYVRDEVPLQVRADRKAYPDHYWVTRTPEWHRGGFEDWFAFEVNNKPFDGFYYHQDEANPRPLNGYQADALTDLAIDYLREYDRDQPLLLVLSIEPPHFPLDAPQRNRRLDPAALHLRPNVADDPKLREQLATYYAMVENLDENIGRLLDALSKDPRFADNTLVTYISDHGDLMGAHGFINRKEHAFEESVRIPYLFHWPQALPAQGVNDEFISLVDFVPTLLGLVGAPIPPHVQGRDLSPAVRQQPHTAQDAILLEMHGTPRWNMDFPDWRGVVTRRWKYCIYDTGHELLFDLQNDPYELTNRVEELPEIRQELRSMLLAMMRETREPYFDVLMEHAVRPAPTKSVGPRIPGSGLSPWWRDGSVQLLAPAPKQT